MKIDSSLKWHVLLCIALFVSLMPIVFAISTSFKELSEAYGNVLGLIPHNPTMANYLRIFQELPLNQITLNTVIVAFAVTVFKIVTSVMAAYAFVYFNFKGKNLLYIILISTIFIPFTMTMIPNYLIISQIGLRNNIIGVILPQLSDATGIFLIRQAMRSIPLSFIEAARLEQAGIFHIMFGIVLPLAKPAVISTGIMFFINSWNEYVWPVLILKDTANYTLPLALQLFISSEGGTDFCVAMAVSVVTMIIPLGLYLIFQKYIISTFTSSGVKG
ncbi:carbohydrate ABC transporter permease [Pectinatus haikarae]|uniref:Sn-glycerol 3-phosphate transport system permease protein n=1 Tax=Pectinatus haikarae TaxID=349096 RepID=A0ABT9Y692_9FIRM|nr:carbohydrate ABC transporter permease [Pectinatus haikarae]MDQ0203350.1 sn-glycerol 3-phosphate transport system permease protein [Pectinatus haikarae]